MNTNPKIILNEIQTKLGTVYIESLISARKDDSEIKIYDSNQQYIDCFNLDFLKTCAKNQHITVEEEYTTRLTQFKSCDNIRDLLNFITTEMFELCSEKSDATLQIGNHYFKIHM